MTDEEASGKESWKERHEARLRRLREAEAQRKREKTWWTLVVIIGIVVLGLLWAWLGMNWLLGTASFVLLYWFARIEIQGAIRDGISDSLWQMQDTIREAVEEAFSGLHLSGDLKEANAEISGLTEKITEAVEEGVTRALEQHKST